MTEQSKLEWTEYKSRFRALTAYGTYWVDTAACSAGYQLICGTNPCCEVFSSPQEAKDFAQIIHDRASSRDDWFNLSDIEQAPYHAPLDLAELLRTYETLLAGDNLPERIAVQTVDLRALLNAAKPVDVAAWAQHLLSTWDQWYSCRQRDDEAKALSEKLILASCFAGTAYDAAMSIPIMEDKAPEFLLRIFLIALIDQNSPELDPYRANYSPHAAPRADDGTKPVDVVAVREQPWYITTPHLDPFAAGFESNQADIDDGNNPFAEGTPDAQDWTEGWESASDEAAAIRALSAEPAQADRWHDISFLGERELGRLIVIGAFDGKGRWCATVRRAQRFIDHHNENAGSLKKAMRLKWEPTHFMELTAPHRALSTLSRARHNQQPNCCTHCNGTHEVHRPDSEFLSPCPECAPTTEAGK